MLEADGVRSFEEWGGAGRISVEPLPKGGSAVPR